MFEKNVYLAFRIIRRNYGCPGMDGISIKEIKKNYDYYKNLLITNFNAGKYTFCPPKKVSIVDFLNKPRDIFVYSVLDRWMQQVIRLVIEPYVETKLRPYVFAYRRGKNFNTLVENILQRSPNYVLWLDIVDFNNSIDREILIHQLKKIQSPPKYINAAIQTLNHVPYGIPAGNCLSPMLSNLYLTNIDDKFTKNYCRFADDMFFDINDSKLKDDIIFKLVPLINNLKLTLNHKKTKIIDNPSRLKAYVDPAHGLVF